MRGWEAKEKKERKKKPGAVPGKIRKMRRGKVQRKCKQENLKGKEGKEDKLGAVQDKRI